MKLLLVALIMVLSVCLIIYNFILWLVPAAELPIILDILGMTGLFISWLFFGSLCAGLSKVVGAGYGSAGKIVESIVKDTEKELDASIDKHKAEKK